MEPYYGRREILHVPDLYTNLISRVHHDENGQPPMRFAPQSPGTRARERIRRRSVSSGNRERSTSAGKLNWLPYKTRN